MAIYVRVNPRSQLESRHRAGLLFTALWLLIDVDDADRAAIEQDPYLEVSESDPTEIETAAVETELELPTTDGKPSGQAPDGFEWVLKPNLDDVPVGLLNNPPSTNSDGALAQVDAVIDSAESATVDSSGDAPEVVEVAEAVPETDPNQAPEVVEVTEAAPETDPNQAIKDAINQLDKGNKALWLVDGRPSTKAIEEIVGVTVSSGLRDLVWADIRTEAAE